MAASPFGILRKRRRVTVDSIVRFYKHQQKAKKRRLDRLFDAAEVTLTNTPTGLGDCVVLTDHIQHGRIWSPSKHFKDLVDDNPYYRDEQTPLWLSMSAAVRSYDLGGGHCIQRIRRAFGMPVDPMPAGFVFSQSGPVQPFRVTVHFEAGDHAAYQKRAYHPKAREVYPENLDVIRRFFKERPQFEVIEVGSKRVLGDPAIDMTNRSLRETMAIMSRSGLHLGIISGPYHLAHALGLRTICVINFPSPHRLMIPSLVDAGVVESEWIYPTTNVLHQDADSDHWPRFSYRTLCEAFNGEVYPYDSAEQFANLINE